MNSIELAKICREDVVRMAYLSKGSHVASALSIVDILSVLYNDIMNISIDNYKDENRDRFILSKGHAGSALYSVLAREGFFDPTELSQHYANGSRLSGHVSHKELPGVEISTGSLGHGISIAAGFALAGKLNKKDYKVYTIIGDGECDEGTVWESALFASQFKLNNLTVIVDRNKLQALGNCKDIMNTESLNTKFKSFGFEVYEIDGHNHDEIRDALLELTDKPKCIIANTIKGKGVSFMENKLLWHYRNPSEEEYEIAIKEIRGENNA